MATTRRENKREDSRLSLALLVNLALLILLIPTALFLGEASQTVISEIRLPRIATAIAAGIALALAGVVSQAIFVNPIIEPSLLGLNSSAALGAVLGVVLGIAEVGTPLTIPFAIAGALIGAVVIVKLSEGRSSLILILNGVAITALTTAIVGGLIGLLDRNDIRSFSFWSFGSLALADWKAALTITIALLVSLPLLLLAKSGLDLLSLGEANARHIGLDLKRLRIFSFFTIAVLVAATVSTIGSIAFLGLASAHIARVIVGPRQNRLLPVAALIAANILLIADTLARRALFPQEVPIGFIIAIIAAPILIWALRGQRVWKESA